MGFKLWIIGGIVFATIIGGLVYAYNDMQNTIKIQAEMIGTIKAEVAVQKDTINQLQTSVQAANDAMTEYNMRMVEIQEAAEQTRKELDDRKIQTLAPSNPKLAEGQVNAAIDEVLTRLEHKGKVQK